MPNWCCQNSVLIGPKEDVERFCKTVNSVLGKPDVMPNDYGKFWLGNVCEAFGYNARKLDRKGVNIRGNLDANPWTEPSWACPEPEVRELVPEAVDGKTSKVSFSITSAWRPSDWFMDMLTEQFPSLTWAWKATDEFGTFHWCQHPELLGLKRYELLCYSLSGDIEEPSFDKNEEEAVAEFLNGLTRREDDPFTAEEIAKGANSVYKKLREWNDAHEDEEIYISIWDEISR